MFCKKVVFKNFVKLTGKTCWCCYFCRPATLLKKRLRHILKNFFFIEHLRWLLLPTLKPLDSLRQLCKWISKLVTVYFISTFLVLVGIFMFIFGKHKLSFYISIALWLRRYDVFDFSRDLTIEVSRDFLGGAPHPDSAPYQVLGLINLVNVDLKYFWFVTWSHDWCVTWPSGWGPLILSPQPAKFWTP